MSPRIASPADADAFAALDAAAGAAGWRADAYATLLAEPSGLGTIIDGAGFALVQVAADTADVVMAAVAPDARRRGVARTCLETALQAARQKGATRAVLEVARGNAPARALYATMGFTEVGVRCAYYETGPHAGDDALVLALDLA